MCHSCPLHFAVAKMLLLRLTIVHPVLWDQAGENKRGTKHYFWAAKKRRHSESDPPTSRTLTLLLSLVENMLSRANVMLGWLLACQIPVDKLSAPNIVSWRHLFPAVLSPGILFKFAQFASRDEKLIKTATLVFAQHGARTITRNQCNTCSCWSCWFSSHYRTIALFYIAPHCSTSPYIALHCSTLFYIAAQHHRPLPRHHKCR